MNKNISSDIQKLSHQLESKKILCFGESTHGTNEFFTFKKNLFQKLVIEQGVTIFALEAYYDVCIQIDQYIKGVNHNLQELIWQLFKVWQTENMYDLIQ